MRHILTLLLFVCTPLLADEAIDLEGQTYDYGSQFINMLLTLGFVLVLIFASVWLLKKIMRSRLTTMNRSHAIKVVERRPLNPKASLYLVDILGKGVVISESPAGIQLITEFPKEVDIEDLLEQQHEEQKPRVSFSQVFTQTIKKMKSKNAT